jgi:uncharacterized tellurite resistance protein B-like protein
MDATTSRQVCEIIVGLLLADGELHANEAKFLARVRARFGIGSDVDIVPVTDPNASIARLRGLSAEARYETLSLLIDAAGADGVLHPAERIFLGAVGEELGVSEDDLDARIATALRA